VVEASYNKKALPYHRQFPGKNAYNENSIDYNGTLQLILWHWTLVLQTYTNTVATPILQKEKRHGYL
jgi:hypothetical protein